MLLARNFIFVFLIASNCVAFCRSFDPVKSEIKLCQVFNLEVLTCYWDVYLIGDKQISLNLFYTKGFMTDKAYRDLPASHLTKCQRDESKDGNATTHWCQLHYKKHSIRHIPFTFILLSSNTSLVSNSQPLFIRDLYSIYKPGLTHGIHVNNTTSITTHVHWKPPNRKSHLYQLLYHVSNGISNKSVETEQTNYILQDLRPHHNYHLSIRSSYRSSPFWSDWMSFQFETLQDVPSASVTVSQGSFKRLNSTQLKVIWKRISEELKNGIIVKTSFQTLEECELVMTTLFRDIKKKGLRRGNHSNMMITVKEYDEELTQVILETNCKCRHLVFVDQATIIDYNTSLTLKPLYIPSQLEVPPGIKPSTLKATVNESGDFNVEWDKIPNSISYRLFYWQYSLNQLTKYSSFNLSTPFHNFHLPASDPNIWKFAVSTQYYDVDGDTTNSEMVEIPCVYSQSKEFSSESLNLQYRSTLCSIILHWPPSDCSDNYPPYLSYYLVSYAPSKNPNNYKEIRLEKWEHNLTIDQLVCKESYNLNLSAVIYNHSVLLNQIHVTISSKSFPWILLVAVMLVLVVASCSSVILCKCLHRPKKVIVVTTLPRQYNNNNIEEED